MLSRISKAVAQWLSRNEAVSSEDEGLYEYAVFMAIFGLYPLALAVILGLFFNMLAESVTMIIPFVLLRKFCGGYHCQNSIICTISSSAVICLGLLAIKAMCHYQMEVVALPLVSISAISVSIFSPIDSDARRLSNAEQTLFRKIAQIASVVLVLLAASLFVVNVKQLSSSISIGTCIVAILQFPCIYIRLKERNCEKT